jgi:hypothetical protein
MHSGSAHADGELRMRTGEDADMIRTSEPLV